MRKKDKEWIRFITRISKEIKERDMRTVEEKGLGFSGSGLGFSEVYGFEFRVDKGVGLGFRVSGFEFRVYRLGFKVEGCRLGV